jgi:hypothetical protein
MRILGMFLLGFGIMFLIMAGFFFTNPPGGLGPILVMLAFVAFVTVPMVICGIAIIRKAESQNSSDKLAKPEMFVGEKSTIQRAPGIGAWNPFNVLHRACKESCVRNAVWV